MKRVYMSSINVYNKFKNNTDFLKNPQIFQYDYTIRNKI